MSQEVSITHWLERLRHGDAAAAGVMFRAYFERLAHLARAHLSRSVRRAADQEDVALAALHSFFRGVQAGHFVDLHDREDLWCLLLTITLFKARDLAHRDNRQRHGSGRTVSAIDLLNLFGEPDADLDRLAGPQPPPELVASFAEEVRHQLEQLAGDDLRRVALARLEGHTVAESATRLGMSRRGVERKLRLIRQIWQEPGVD
jgi:DNA-directed RNA polymerase specialized sigma24 family protein